MEADSSLQAAPGKPTRENPPEFSSKSTQSGNGNGTETQLDIEMWLVELYSNRSSQQFSPDEWLLAKMKGTKDSQDVWNRFAKLRPVSRKVILEFIEHRNRSEILGWSLYHLEFAQRWSPIRLLRHDCEEGLVQLVLCRRKAKNEEVDTVQGELKRQGLKVNDPKHVSFQEELIEKANTREVIETTESLERQKRQARLREQLKKLEVTKDRLDTLRDQGRIRDIEDMILFLRGQLREQEPLADARSHHMTDGRHQWTPDIVELRPARGAQESISPGYSHSGNHSSWNKRATIDSHADGPRRGGSYDDDFTRPGRRPYIHDSDSDAVGRYSSPEGRRFYNRHDRRENSRHSPRRRRVSHSDSDWVKYDPRSQANRRMPQSHSRLLSPEPRFFYEERIVSREHSPRRSKSRPSRRPSTDASSSDEWEIRSSNNIEESRRRPPRPSFSSQRPRRSRGSWSPQSKNIVSRATNRSKPRARERLDSTSGASERRHGGFGEPDGGSSTSLDRQALVPRAGVSSLPRDYLQGRVLNSGIRVRGDDDIYRPRSESRHFRPLGLSQSSREDSKHSRSRGTLFRRPVDDYFGISATKRTDRVAHSPEPELSDGEIVRTIMRKFTTVQENDLPAPGTIIVPGQANPSSAIVLAPRGGPGVLKTGSNTPNTERKSGVPGRRAHFEQDGDEPAPNDESQAEEVNGKSKLSDEDTPAHNAEEGDDDVDNIRPISRNPTVQEEEAE